MKKALLGAMIAVAACGAANAAELGFYAGFDGGVTFRHGTSNVTNAGASPNVGVIHDVQFDAAPAVGAYVGYQFSPRFSTRLSFHRIDGKVAWKTKFSAVQTSTFSADARTDVWMVSALYRQPISPSTSVQLHGGLGASINGLADISERGQFGGQFEIVGGRRTSFATNFGVTLEHQFKPAIVVSGGFGASYLGDFESGASRTIVSSGLIEQIVPYRLTNTWAGTFMASLRVNF